VSSDALTRGCSDTRSGVARACYLSNQTSAPENAPREFCWPDGPSVTERSAIQLFFAKPVIERARLKMIQTETPHAPCNQRLEGTPPRCALRRRSRARWGRTVNKKSVAAFLLLVMPAVGHCAWSVAYPDLFAGQKEISDDPFEFQLGGMQCGVEKTNFIRTADDQILQARILHCWTAANTKVSVTANCLPKPLISITTLEIQVGERKYFPSVVCGPTK
jgi:hypothetical protein